LAYFGIKPSNPWIIYGIAYGGTLAAWFRVKYPSLSVGAISSSAMFPVNVTFSTYDQ
jgi:hypothetical protein